MDFILENLAIGNCDDVEQPLGGIDALLCVAEERDIHKPKLLYLKVPIVDMRPIPPAQMKEAVEWIRDNIPDHKIMVFCKAGIGRSPSVVIGYLCCLLGYSFGDAVEHVARKRPIISTLPNLIITIQETKKLLT